MADLEKVKKGLDLCLTGEPSTCKDCPYNAECKEARGIGPSPLRRDALELLNEQKYGHWIRSPKFLSEAQCSVCKETYVGDCRTFNYCPECGAKMDGEVMQE